MDSSLKRQLYRSGQVEVIMQNLGLGEFGSNLSCRMGRRYGMAGEVITELAMVPTYFFGYGLARLALRAGVAGLSARGALALNMTAKASIQGIQAADDALFTESTARACFTDDFLVGQQGSECSPETEFAQAMHEAEIGNCVTNIALFGVSNAVALRQLRRGQSDVSPRLKVAGTVALSEREKTIAREIILSGSSRVSRTIEKGNRFMAPETVTNADVSAIAQMNFEVAVEYMLNNLDDLEINLETATLLNRMLTNKLIPENVRGNHLFRPKSPYGKNRTDRFVKGDPKKFYLWLESAEAKKIAKDDPVSFAEVIHHNIVGLDSFPDGNGRLSRLLADLALLKAGRAPANYTSMEDYFKRGKHSR